MSKFVWKQVTNAEDGEMTISLIEIFEDSTLIFWASIHPVLHFNDMIYEVAAYNKDRQLQTLKETFTDLDVAKEVIGEFLIDQGVLPND